MGAEEQRCRIVVACTPDAKARIMTRASADGIPMGEVLLRAAFGVDKPLGPRSLARVPRKKSGRPAAAGESNGPE